MAYYSDAGPARVPSMTMRFAAVLFLAALCAILPAAAESQLSRIGALSAAGVSDELKHAVEAQGYRITLDDGWMGEFWFVKQLKTVTKDVPGAIYPELTDGELIGVASLPKGMTDFRGQTIPAGTYTLRYQLLPQDGNHMGASAYPDFLLAIPAGSDPDPDQHYLYKKLVALSARSTGTNHPAVIALQNVMEPKTTSKTPGSQNAFEVEIPIAGGGSERLDIVVKGTAAQ